MTTFDGRRILITASAGSLGCALVHRLLSGKNATPARIIVLSRDQAKQHEMRLSHLRDNASTDDDLLSDSDTVGLVEKNGIVAAKQTTLTA